MPMPHRPPSSRPTKPAPTPKPLYVLREPTVAHIRKYYAIDHHTGLITNLQTDHVFLRPPRTLRITRTAATWTFTKLAWVLYHGIIPETPVQVLDGDRHNLREANLCVGSECSALKRRVTSAKLTQIDNALGGFEVTHAALSDLLRDFAVLKHRVAFLETTVQELRRQAAAPAELPRSLPLTVDPDLLKRARQAAILSGVAPDGPPD